MRPVRGAVNLIGSRWTLSVLTRKITNVRGAGHFPREGLQGAQEFAYEAEGARGSDNDIQRLTESLTGRARVSPSFDI